MLIKLHCLLRLFEVFNKKFNQEKNFNKMEDLIEFLKICNFQNEKLNNFITETCSSMDQFYEMREKWINIFNMNEQEFRISIKLIDFHKQVLIDCAEFDMEDIANTENYEAFIEYVEKYSSFLKENNLDPDII